MHVGSAIVLDPSTASEGSLTRDRLAAYVAQRLHLAPPFRRRLVMVPLRLDHPVWIEDPDFDLDFHVRRAAVPAPGGLDELAELTGDVMGRPVDRSRPLWELYVVEGMAGGRVALITKTHHAAVDGVSGAELLAALLQLVPEQAAAPPDQEWHPEPVPSDLWLLAGAGVRLAATPLGLARLGRRALSAATDVLRLRDGEDGEDRPDPPPAPFAAPTTVLNGAISPHRRVAFARLPLERVKAVKNAARTDGAPVTVNDVVLSVVAGAVRAFLRHRDQPTPRMVAMVPISVRQRGERGTPGNRVSMMLVALPTDLERPADRLAAVRQGTAGAKEQHGAVGADTLQHLAELAPAGVFSLAARSYTRARAADRHRPIWNTIVSNVPGPRLPLYCAGARLEGLYPLGPVHEMCGLNVTLFSYTDTIFVGLNADRDTVPDVDVVADALVAEVDALAAAVGT